jgi:hypothetical protein
MFTTVSASLSPGPESQITSGKRDIPKSMMFFGLGLWVAAMLFIGFLSSDMSTTWPVM